VLRYIGNMPPKITPLQMCDFLNRAMKQAGLGIKEVCVGGGVNGVQSLGFSRTAASRKYHPTLPHFTALRCIFAVVCVGCTSFLPAFLCIASFLLPAFPRLLSTSRLRPAPPHNTVGVCAPGWSPPALVNRLTVAPRIVHAAASPLLGRCPTDHSALIASSIFETAHVVRPRWCSSQRSHLLLGNSRHLGTQ
jgi:hypothetical protein